MVFSDFQNYVNKGWEKKIQQAIPQKPIPQETVIKQHLCKKCAKKGKKVKMDYIGNDSKKMTITVYDVSFYRCPACGFVNKEFNRVEGKGTTGRNMGVEYGSR